jgi:hypothetical protein
MKKIERKQSSIGCITSANHDGICRHLIRQRNYCLSMIYCYLTRFLWVLTIVAKSNNYLSMGTSIFMVSEIILAGSWLNRIKKTGKNICQNEIRWVPAAAGW